MPTIPSPLLTDDIAPAGAHPPRAAATLVVVRDGDEGIEVLLCRRAERGDHNSGAWVFPGGIVDAGDRDAHRWCHGLDDREASRRLGLSSGGLDFYVAAVRECFEECGLLYAVRAGHTFIDTTSTVDAWRGPLHRGERHIGDLCDEAGVVLAVDRLIYLSHWLTPLGRPKRFDTRFFIASVPPAQSASPDGTEMLEQRWFRPADVLRRSAELKLMTPTQKTLEQIVDFTTVAALLSWASTERSVPMTMPRVGQGKDGTRPVLPGEPAYAELRRIDPGGHGHGSYDIVADRPVRLSPHVIRVTAGNGNEMTGPGTNTYLVGGGASGEWAVIDPGPLDDTHVQAIIDTSPGRITRIFATHTHSDHSPATLSLKRRTGAVVHGQIARYREWQDASFEPDVALQGGERVVLDEGLTLQAIHTPGHASNHLCYWFEEEETLFTGDHLMQMSTVVINPPDGDMTAYLASLRSLLSMPLRWLAPGHGFLMSSPHDAIEAVIAHRLKRERKVIDALQAAGPSTIGDLLPAVYADVPPRLHQMALRSLSAHLLKLRDDGAALEHDGRWTPVG